MVTRVSSKDAGARRFDLGRRAAPLFGPIAFAALALLGGALVSPPAQAGQQLCGDRGQILKRLEQGHEETRRALGLSVVFGRDGLAGALSERLGHGLGDLSLEAGTFQTFWSA